jgi:N-formylglutamate amidohydrolase
MDRINNTLLMEDTFLDEIRGQIILHIPHSKTEIPIYEGFNTKLIESETNLLVDHATDKIFNIPNVESLVFKYNRIFCDVERLDDEVEPLFKKGRGFYYTHTDGGELLRETLPHIKSKIKSDYYDRHHHKLEEMVEERLEKYDTSLIIDCHSFTDQPFQSDFDKGSGRPDICLGTDDYHTPKWLITKMETHFRNHNLTVKINSPYSGTIIPLKYYQKDKRVKGIMIEINRNLYMENGQVNEVKVQRLNDMIVNLI